MREEWSKVKIGDLFDTLTGNTPPKKDKTNYGQDIPLIKPPELQDKPITQASEFLSLGGGEKARLVPRDTVLVTCIGNLGRTGISKERIAFNQQINAIKPKCGIEPKFTFYQCQSPAFRKSLENLSSATTVSIVNKSKFNTIEYSVAPPPEQRAIILKLEESFSELDNGIENLNKAKEKLVIYRQAVLKKAFEGKLTKKWRNEQLDLQPASELLKAIKEERMSFYENQLLDWNNAVIEWDEKGKEGKRPIRIRKPNIADDVSENEVERYGALPVEWEWSRFCNVTYKIGDVDHKMPKDFPGGIPYLSTGNLRVDSTIDFDKAKTISNEDYTRLALKIKPEKGDMLFPRYGTIGRNVLVSVDKKFLVSYSCAIIKNIMSLMNEKYVYYYSISPVIKKEIKRYKVETTQANIGIASIEKFVFPICSRSEQREVVKEIETRLSVCDNILENIEEDLKKAEALRLSILEKAFDGKLLSEEEIIACRREKDWESAERLLERIKKIK